MRRREIPVGKKREFFQESMFSFVDGPAPDYLISLAKIGVLEGGSRIRKIPAGGPFRYVAV